MPTPLDEILIKLGVDASEAEKAREALKRLTETIADVPEKADSAFAKAGAAVSAFGAAAKGAFETVAGAAKSALAFPADLFSFVDKGTEGLDKIAKSARATGQTAEEVQRLGFVASQAGASASAVAQAAGRLNKALAEIPGGGAKSAKTALDLLGLSFKELVPLSTTERLTLISERLALVQSEGLKNVVRNKLFGRAGGQLASFLADPGDISETAAQASVATNEQVAAAEKLNDAIGLAKNQLGGFRTTVLTALTPTIKSAVDATNEWLMANKEWINTRINEAVQLGVEAARGLVPLLKQGADAVALWVRENDAWIRSEFPEKLKEFGKGFLTFASLVKEAGRAVDDLGVGLTVIKEGILGSGVGGRGGPSLAEAIAEVRGRAARERAEREAKEQAAEDKKFLEEEFSGVDFEKHVTGQLQLSEVQKALGALQTKQILDERKAVLQAKVNAAKKRFETPRGKAAKKEKVRSGITFDEALETLLGGTEPSEEIKRLSAVTPSTREIKPTVAIDYFNFVVTQNINASDPLTAGTAAANSIKTVFEAGKKAKGGPISNVVR